MAKTNHITALNIEVLKWTVLSFCNQICVDWDQRLEKAMQLFTYDSEEVETSIFSFLWDKNQGLIDEAKKQRI